MQTTKDTVMHNVHNKALTMGLAGNNAKAVQAATGLNHTQYDVAKYVWQWYYVWKLPQQKATPEVVAALRYYGFSIGYIRIALGTNPVTGQCLYSEGHVNKLYAMHTGTQLHGTRNGRGGAYLANTPSLYNPATGLQRTGTTLTAEEVAALRAGGSTAVGTALLRQQWLNLGAGAMRTACKAAGLPYTKATPAQMAMALAKAEAPLPEVAQ